MYRIIVLTAALVGATPATAQRLVSGFDLAGVHLGDDAAQARAALTKSGYKIETSYDAPTFEQDVAREAARRQDRSLPWSKNSGTSSIIAEGPHREHTEVKFVQRPGGSKVTSITVLIPGESMTGDALRAQLTGKYGKPDSVRSIGTSLTWCSPEVLRVCGVPLAPNGPLDTAYPNFSANILDQGFLKLDGGILAETKARSEREAAILRLAPRTDKVAF